MSRSPMVWHVICHGCKAEAGGEIASCEDARERAEWEIERWKRDHHATVKGCSRSAMTSSSGRKRDELDDDLRAIGLEPEGTE